VPVVRGRRPQRPARRILGLVAVGITLTASPVVYQTVEKIQTVVIVAVIVWLVLAVFLGTTADGWSDFVSGFASFGSITTNDAVTAAALAGAIAFAGSGGCGNLAISNWVRDKGMGMGAYIPRIVLADERRAGGGAVQGTTFEPDEENMRRWRGWWKVANTEQAVTFWLIGTLGIVVLSVLAYSTVFGKDTGEDFDFIKTEGEVLKDTVAPWFATVFWLAGFFKLLSTMLGNFDYVSRITADAVKINATPDSTRWTESRIYAVTVWGLIVVGIAILLLFTDQPLVLLVIAPR
jgi:hypothetical protein